MAKNEAKRLKASLLQNDKDAFTALLRVTGYAPMNNRYSFDTLETTVADLIQAHQAEAEAVAALTGARQNAVAKEWEFHNLMLGAKDQVVAQFGRDSNEAAAVGLKKKSEYKTRPRKTPGNEAQPLD